MPIEQQLLSTAIEAAQQAGQVLVHHWPNGRTITRKGYRDIVTDADTAAEDVILNTIRARFPEHAIISEEAGGDQIGDNYTWIIDPLDGTTNYAHRAPIFAVSIGVLEKDEPLIGVVHDPLRNHTFVAKRGQGATLNGASIRVSNVTRLGEAVVGLDWGRSNEIRERVLEYLHHIVVHCGTLRGVGSATLTLAYIATGWLDAYFHLAIRPWDAAAGVLLITEAGGRCTTLEDEPYRVDSPACLMSNGLIHTELLGVMHNTS